MIEVIPTYVPRSREDLAAGAAKIRTFATGIHVDVDDGIFAPHLTWPYVSPGGFEPFDLSVLAALDVEVHLMVERPRDIGIAFVHAGAMRLIGHMEGFNDPSEARGTLEAWRKAGAPEVGLGFLLDSPLAVLEPLIGVCDVVHLMSIATIGTQGIPYDLRILPRIGELHARYPELMISVDGGVSETNIAELVLAGATRFGVGSAISKSADPKAAYENLKTIAENALQ